MEEDLTSKGKLDSELMCLRRRIAELEYAQRQLKEALRYSEKRLRALGDVLPIPVAISRKSDGVVLYANALCGQLAGVPVENLIGGHAQDFYYSPSERQSWAESIRIGSHIRNQAMYVKKIDGTPQQIIWAGRLQVIAGEAVFIIGVYKVKTGLWPKLNCLKLPDEQPEPPFCSGNLVIDFARQRVTRDGRELNLTITEYKLLCYLARNVGRVLSPDEILKSVWGNQHGYDAEILEVNICRLRQKLGDDTRNPRYIVTKRGMGYVMAEP